MAEKNPTTASHRPVITEEMRMEYFRLLTDLVRQHGEASGAMNAQLRAIVDNPDQPITLGVIDTIKVLCDCENIGKIIDCLCEWITGSSPD